MIKIQKRKWHRWWMFLLFALATTGCSYTSVDDLGREVIGHLTEGRHEDAYDFFSKELKETMPLHQLEADWEKKTKNNGPFIEINELNSSERGESYTVVEAELEYSEAIVQVRLTFDDVKQLTGIHVSDGVSSAVLPDTVVEEEVIIGKGTKYELEGMLSLPKMDQEKLPAVVLVHGSGPSDRDEGIYGYKPFRDIAWGLAQRGVAVLRYEKRTFAYQNQFTVKDVKHLTVKGETIEDAVKAADLLKSDSRIDSNRVYIIGHSLGGMLTPRIDAEGGDFAGLIMLAGSPRPLWEIIFDQNIAALKGMKLDEKTQKQQGELIREQFEKARQLKEMSKEQALEETIFGVPAFYFKEMDEFDIESYLLSLEKPILILQGEDDFQVYFTKDYALWKDMLQNRPNTSFKSYPGLNHFFVQYSGQGKGTVEEYKQPGIVSGEVLEDIAEWILKQH